MAFRCEFSEIAAASPVGMFNANWLKFSALIQMRLTKQNHVSHVWDIIEKAPVGILTTRFVGGLRARSLEARVDRDAGIIWFVTDVRGTKDDKIGAAHDIGLVFYDEDACAHLSITGRTSVTRDTGKAEEIWKKTDDI